jgi:AcrR family transcriptional regulator
MATKVPQLDDRRIRRTRVALRDALISLLQKRGWDDISVQEICEKADVGRSTFYMHYQGKEQLLADGLEDLRKVLAAHPSGNPGHRTRILPFMRGLMDHVQEQRTLFRALIGRGSGHVVQVRFRRMVAELVKAELANGPGQPWQREATSSYVSGAIVELLSWWVEARPARSLEEVEQLFNELTAPIVARLMRPAKSR